MKRNKHYPLALKTALKLKESGYRVLFAGGCVRDSLMGNYSADIDIATSATPEEIQKLFPKTLLVGAHFGVVVVIEHGVHFEVATFRKDGAYSNGRHPDSVLFTDEKEDALRRDFTVNGLFFDPFEEKVINYVDGIADIERRVIKTIGKPEDRFTEDKLRLLRAVRFSAKLGFSIDHDTLEAMGKMAPLISQVSRERIREEMFKLFAIKDILPSLNLMKSSGLWDSVFLFPYQEQQAKLCAKLSPEILPELRLFSLCFQKDREGLEKVSSDFKLSRKQLEHLQSAKKILSGFENYPTARLSTLKRIFRIPEYQGIFEFLKEWQKIFKSGELEIINLMEEKYRENKNSLETEKIISGEDLKDMGLNPSPVFREILEEVENLQLENIIHTREEAIAKALQLKESYAHQNY